MLNATRHTSDTYRLSATKPGSRCRALLGFALICSLALTGCFVPLHTYSMPVNELPEVYRAPTRTFSPQLNLSKLSPDVPTEYILGPGDSLQALIPGLFTRGEIIPLTVQVGGDGTVTLPLLEPVKVTGMNLAEAQQAIDDAYTSNDILTNPRVNTSLAARYSVSVSVIGEVTRPGVYELSRYENDVAHAIAQAEGLSQFAGQIIEIHRRATHHDAMKTDQTYIPTPGEEIVLRIPLQGESPTIKLADGAEFPLNLSESDVVLRPGDVVNVPRQVDQVFFVVGPLDDTRVVNFTVQDRDRELGNAFLLPPNRDIDVVTAVAMAGYIDPIDSPSTVTLHRSQLGRSPMLVHIDLIKARYDWNENMYVEPGDIIYLNPDAAWWMRRTFDQIVPELLLSPYREAMFRWINPLAGIR